MTNRTKIVAALTAFAIAMAAIGAYALCTRSKQKQRRSVAVNQLQNMVAINSASEDRYAARFLMPGAARCLGRFASEGTPARPEVLVGAFIVRNGSIYLGVIYIEEGFDVTGVYVCGPNDRYLPYPNALPKWTPEEKRRDVTMLHGNERIPVLLSDREDGKDTIGGDFPGIRISSSLISEGLRGGVTNRDGSVASDPVEFFVSPEVLKLIAASRPASSSSSSP